MRQRMKRSPYERSISSACSTAGADSPTAIQAEVRMVVTPAASSSAMRSGVGAAKGEAMISKGRSAVPASSRTCCSVAQCSSSSWGE